MATELQTDALLMSDQDWKSAKAIAASGRLPTAAQQFKIRLNAEIALAEAARAAPPPTGNTSSTEQTPTPKVGMTGVMQMSRAEYRSARDQIIKKSESDHRERLERDNRVIVSIPPIGSHKTGF